MCTVTLALVLNARTLHAGEIKVVPRFSALPVITGFTQKVEISLPPDVPEGGQFDVIVEASSGGGVMLFPSGPSDSGSVACS
ncbi:MAG: hypothetical protein LBQ36_02985, partial [Synergistaceae bacterium]|nr:hypothetical protein [Synergistaceae bacterium]